jgi:hypothetical protein
MNSRLSESTGSFSARHSEYLASLAIVLGFSMLDTTVGGVYLR